MSAWPLPQGIRRRTLAAWSSVTGSGPDRRDEPLRRPPAGRPACSGWASAPTLPADESSQHLAWGAVRDDPSLVQDDHPVRVHRDPFQLVLRQDDRRARHRRAPSSVSNTSRVPTGSSCEVGSSSTSTFGRMTIDGRDGQRAAAARRRARMASGRPGPPARSAAAPRRSRPSISSRGQPRFSSPNASSSRTVKRAPVIWLNGLAKTSANLACQFRNRRVDEIAARDLRA